MTRKITETHLAVVLCVGLSLLLTACKEERIEVAIVPAQLEKPDAHLMAPPKMAEVKKGTNAKVQLVAERRQCVAEFNRFERLQLWARTVTEDPK